MQPPPSAIAFAGPGQRRKPGAKARDQGSMQQVRALSRVGLFVDEMRQQRREIHHAVAQRKSVFQRARGADEGFEPHRRLPFEILPLREAQQGGGGVEQPSKAGRDRRRPTRKGFWRVPPLRR